MTTDETRARFHAFEHEGWRRAAGHYAAGFAPMTAQVIEPLLDAAAVGKGTRLLDVASGPGDLAAEAARRGAIATGADFAPEMVALARSRHPGLEYVEADAQALPFADGSFDAVTAAFLVGHLAEPERAIAEAHRVLRPDGRFAFAWWQGLDRALAFAIVMDAIRAHGTPDVGLPAGPPFDRFSDPAVCRDALVAARFADVHVEEVPLVWHPPSAEAVFDTYLDGSVRTAGVLRGQTPEALAAIRAAVIAAVRSSRVGDRIELPMPAWVASGRKP